MRRQLIMLFAISFTVTTAAYGVRRSNDQDRLPFRPEVIYFAHHINARLEDSSFRGGGWGMARVRKELEQMTTVFQTTNNHDDLVKEAVDLAVAAMMAAHREGRQSRQVVSSR